MTVVYVFWVAADPTALAETFVGPTISRNAAECLRAADIETGLAVSGPWAAYGFRLTRVIAHARP